MFGQDPVMLYQERDTVKWMIRSAAYAVIARDRSKQQPDQQQPQQ